MLWPNHLVEKCILATLEFPKTFSHVASFLADCIGMSGRAVVGCFRYRRFRYQRIESRRIRFIRKLGPLLV